MAGHSKFKNIMHRKNAQDKKRSKLFTKAVKEIEVAARSGSPDPESNTKLRNAIGYARSINLPKDRIENAIKKATSDPSGANYEEIRYEGFANGGYGVIIEALTDNRNRTASDIRSTFTKFGGTLVETGSVSYMFSKLGILNFEHKIDESDLIDLLIEVKALDYELFEDGFNLLCDVDDLAKIREKIEKSGMKPKFSRIFWQSESKMDIIESDLPTLRKLINTLDELDDVREVFTNFDLEYEDDGDE